MKNVESWKAWVFVGSLGTIAILINSNRGIQNQSPTQGFQQPFPPPLQAFVGSTGVVHLTTGWQGIKVAQGHVRGTILTTGVWWQLRLDRDDKRIYTLHPPVSNEPDFKTVDPANTFEWRIMPGQAVTTGLLVWEITRQEGPDVLPPPPDHVVSLSPPNLPSTPEPESEIRVIPIIPPPRIKSREEKEASDPIKLAKYVNDVFGPKSQGETLAICVISEDDIINPHVAEALAKKFRSPQARALTALLTQAFVSDGLFDSAFRGSLASIGQLQLTRFLDILLLGRQNVEYARDASFQNGFTASMRLELISMATAPGIQAKRWRIQANGTGMTQREARSQAEQHLVTEIASRTPTFFDHVPELIAGGAVPTSAEVATTRSRFNADDSLQQLSSRHSTEEQKGGTVTAIDDKPKVSNTFGDLGVELQSLKIVNGSQFLLTLTLTNKNSKKPIWLALSSDLMSNMKGSLTDSAGTEFQTQQNFVSGVSLGTFSRYSYNEPNTFSPATELKPNESTAATVKFVSRFGKSPSAGTCQLQVEFLVGHTFSNNAAGAVSFHNLICKIDAD